jgi:hypothetical protein
MVPVIHPRSHASCQAIQKVHLINIACRYVSTDTKRLSYGKEADYFIIKLHRLLTNRLKQF